MTSRCLFLLAGVCLLAGCTSRGPNLPAVIPVSGKVLLANGEPLPGGRLIFSSKEGSQGGIEPFADIDKDGTFKVTTYQLNDGCIPGQYVVSLNPHSFKSGKALKLPSSLPIPSRYLKEETSDWHVHISPENSVLTLRCKDR